MHEGIGQHLGAIQRQMANANHAGHLAQAQNLNKKVLENFKAMKLATPALVWLLIAVSPRKARAA